LIPGKNKTFEKQSVVQEGGTTPFVLNKAATNWEDKGNN
jgi:hypothetical protein